MSWLKRDWTAAEADRWGREDYVAFVVSPLIYVLLALGVMYSLLLRWYGWVLLGGSLVLLVFLIKVIDPKLKAISHDYEEKQKHYLEDLDRISRWEED